MPTHTDPGQRALSTARLPAPKVARPGVGAPLVLPLSAVTANDVPSVGGKNASLGELIRSLRHAGVRVPDGFAVTAEAFRLHLREAGLAGWPGRRLEGVDVRDTAALATAGAEIRARIASAPLPAALHKAITDAYHELTVRCAREVAGTVPVWLDVAVRSSATAEDLPSASFAGQHETYLHVCGPDALDTAVRRCMGSLFTNRAIAYRAERGIRHEDVALSVGVQQMVRSDLGCAGTLFTLDTESGFRGVVLIDGSWGLGETVVQGRVSPDEWCVHKATAKTGHRSIVRRSVGRKLVKLVYAPQPSDVAGRLLEVPVPEGDRDRMVLTDDEVLQLARWGMLVEDHMAAMHGVRPGQAPAADLEWAKDGRTGELFVLQARPETVHSRRGPVLESFRLQGSPRALVTGKSVGARIGAGPVRVIRTKDDLPTFRDGEVLVAQMTDPDWEPVLRRAAGVVTDHGGRTCHAAIVSRELGLPCVVGTGTATATLRDGRDVTVSCAGGEVGAVFDGRVPFTRQELDPRTMPRTRVPLMLNVADPSHSFRLCQLPCAGVGLLRIEFLVSNRIGIHPMALAHPERVTDPAVREEIVRRTAGHATPAGFFVDRLAEGIGQIAAAFHPRPVIVRFSDFKTNEYAGLLGGAPFEPHEDNPMIGFRGASRYHDDRYRDGFALECAAIRRVRREMGLTNLAAMVPFCRTLGEAKLVLDEMALHGLRRGEDGLQVWVMCEIPNNVVLAGEFAALFDGFSIGSNDLAMLTLGIDRDSDILAPMFDERDPGVRRVIEWAVHAAHANGRKIGICGEAPSNYPDFAEWLARLGIDSMSLNADSLPAVARRLAALPVPPVEVPGSAPG